MYAFHEDTPEHDDYRAWIEQALSEDELVGLVDVVLSGFVRIVTHPGVFDRPASVESALDFVDVLRDRDNVLRVSPGPRHWAVFSNLCRRTGAKGNLVPDAYLAALAIDSGAEMVTGDRGFARFPGLRWRHPLDAG